jgi:DNA polymerase III subunit delta
MTVLRTSALDQHLERKPLAPAYLVYGPDPGKVGEVARHIIQSVAGSLDDPFAVARLEEDMISEDPQRLADEVFSRPMLGTRKAIWISSAGQAFLRAYETMAEAPEDANVLIVEAGNLAKSARLRSLFEKSKTAIAIPCYEDSLEDLDQLIDQVTAAADLATAPDARAALLEVLGDDRALSRAELDKLVLYCHGRGGITLGDVEAVCSGRTTVGADELTDAVFGGDLASTDSLSDRQIKSGVAGFRLLSLASQHVPVLEKLLFDVERGASPSHAVRTARPPIFFSRHDNLIHQLKLWDEASLSSARNSLAAAVEQTRTFPALESQIAQRSLLSIARSAAGRRFGN